MQELETHLAPLVGELALGEGGVGDPSRLAGDVAGALEHGLLFVVRRMAWSFAYQARWLVCRDGGGLGGGVCVRSRDAFNDAIARQSHARAPRPEIGGTTERAAGDRQQATGVAESGGRHATHQADGWSTTRQRGRGQNVLT